MQQKGRIVSGAADLTSVDAADSNVSKALILPDVVVDVPLQRVAAVRKGGVMSRPNVQFVKVLQETKCQTCP